MIIPPTLINLNGKGKVKQWPKYKVPKEKVPNYSLFGPYRSSINHPKSGHYFGQPRDNSHSHDYFDRERTPEEIESSETHPVYMANAYIAEWVSRFNRLEYDYARKPDQERPTLDATTCASLFALVWLTRDKN
uniref:Uncharacterized protein n=1 Tax=Tetranychus urticae TaxID=32264 RepID=T1KWG3_TETUR